MTDKKVKLSKVKGRPMLSWVGKKPLEAVQSYPAQLKTCYGFGDNKKVNIPPLTFNNLMQDWHHLLLHGDNKEILSSLLCKGFRGKIDLIYIDPPFDSKADYVRKVKLRDIDKVKLEGEEQNIIEQTQYEDIWQNDTYLQFMYERLILLRELLSDKGSIYLHCDWHKSHHLRFLLDEVFGEENFVNEIVWNYRSGGASKNGTLARKHDNILFYAKNKNSFSIKTIKERQYLKKPFMDSKQDSKGRFYVDTILTDTINGIVNRVVEKDTIKEYNTRPVLNLSSERTDYPTQKPEGFIEILLEIATNKDSIVLDCFAGSGTLAEVAQNLGRKWIVADMNKGAVQTTAKRLQATINEQNGTIEGQSLIKKFCQYQVNNYDFQQRDQAVQIITECYGIDRIKTDSFFDGIIKNEWIKILDLNRPCNMQDIQTIKIELENRNDETRNARLIASGVEVTVEAELVNYNKTHPINQIAITNIQTDGVILAEPAEAEIKVKRNGNKATISIANYFSPTIMKRLEIERSLFQEHITDFKSQIDYVLIDNDYNGEVFNVNVSDIPANKKDFIKAQYDLTILPKATIAIKIIDMLGEEYLHIDKP